MKKITVRDLEKFASLTDIPLIHLHKLHELDVLDEPQILFRLMKADYKRIKAGCGHFSVRQMTSAIANEYQVSEATVRTAIHERKKVEYRCPKCGGHALRKELKRNHGVCDHCTILKIQEQV